jgi:4'-phosphopantetheinyl transferase
MQFSLQSLLNAEPPSEDHAPWMSLDDNAIHVWQIGLLAVESLIARCRTFLDPAEQERAGRYIHDVHRNRFLVARSALRLLLGRYLGRDPHEVTFAYNAHGRPEISPAPEPPLAFNLSHSGDTALLAVTRLPGVGIDLEYHRKPDRIEDLAERFFAAAEVRQWRALPNELRLAGFFAGWSRKEAYIKAHGRGLNYPLDRFVLSLDPREPARIIETLDDSTEAGRWRIENLSCPEHCSAALVGPAGDWRIERFELQN